MKQNEHACRLCEEKWHALEEQNVYEELQSGSGGLDDQEAARRLEYYGPNTLPTREPPTIWAILLHQVLNPLIFILLAVAGGENASTRHENPPAEKALSGLLLHGLVGFIDPLRPEAVESVKICKTAGIQVLMITGDHPATAGAIAGELGLSDRDEPVVTGMRLSEVGTPDSPAFEKRVASRMWLWPLKGGSPVR